MPEKLSFEVFNYCFKAFLSLLSFGMAEVLIGLAALLVWLSGTFRYISE